MGIFKLGSDKTCSNLTRVVNTFAPIPLFDFKIVRFKDKTHRIPKPRYWLAFRVADDTFCFLSTFTSQTTLLQRYRYDDNALKSIISINKNEFNPPFDAETTYLDCNIKDAEHRRRYSDLADKYIDWHCGLETINHVIPEGIKIKIRTAILNSEFTTDEIKAGFQSLSNTNLVHN